MASGGRKAEHPRRWPARAGSRHISCIARSDGRRWPGDHGPRLQPGLAADRRQLDPADPAAPPEHRRRGRRRRGRECAISRRRRAGSLEPASPRRGGCTGFRPRHGLSPFGGVGRIPFDARRYPRPFAQLSCTARSRARCPAASPAGAGGSRVTHAGAGTGGAPTRSRARARAGVRAGACPCTGASAGDRLGNAARGRIEPSSLESRPWPWLRP